MKNNEKILNEAYQRLWDAIDNLKLNLINTETTKNSPITEKTLLSLGFEREDVSAEEIGRASCRERV